MKKLLALILGLTVVFFAAGATAESSLSLIEEDGYLYCYDQDGNKLTEWQTIDGAKYYFYPYYGYAAKGELGIYNAEVGNYTYYYFGSDGKMQTGWVTKDYGSEGSGKFYYGSDGKRLKEWQTIDGDIYYLDYYGARTGFFTKYDDESGESYDYYFDKDGKLQTGLVIIEAQTDPDDADSVAAGKYYFDKDGKAVSGWKQLNGDWYYFRENGYGWERGGTKHRASTGLTQIEEDYYYFDDTGVMQAGCWIVTDDEDGTGKAKYYLDADGKAVSGWQQIDGAWYYFNSYTRAASSGLISFVGGYHYFFDEEGVMQAGCWRYTGDEWGWRYFSGDGLMVQSIYGVAEAGTEEVYIPPEVTLLNDIRISSVDTGSFSYMTHSYSMNVQSKDFLIRCEPGSYAETFAKEHGISYDNGTERVCGTDITNADEKAEWIVANYVTDGMTDLEKARVLHNWLIHNAAYDYSFSNYDASGVLLRGTGVCESYARAYELLLNKAGVENRFISGMASRDAHAWNLVKIDGNWYHVDCTWDLPGETEYCYFMVNDEYMQHSRTWGTQTWSTSQIRYFDNPGWSVADGKWVYHDEHGLLVTGTETVDGVLYGFTEDGTLSAGGWFRSGKGWHYASPDGAVYRNCWIADNGTYYYFDEDGLMYTGWLEENGKWYWLGEDGAMATGWALAGNSWYYFGADGAMATGWVYDGGNWYYLDENGAMRTGWLQYGSSWYYFTAGGSMAAGWQEIGGQWEMFADSGEWLYTWQAD